jgi:hypothetical protein
MGTGNFPRSRRKNTGEKNRDRANVEKSEEYGFFG